MALADKPRRKHEKQVIYCRDCDICFGAMAMDSVGAGGMIACVMIALAIVLAFAGYASEQLEKERRKTARRIQKLRRQ